MPSTVLDVTPPRPRPRPTAAGVVTPCAGLRYVDDSRPGISRRLHRGRFVYFDSDGRPIRDPDTIARINALAIPPAYVDVWICPDPLGHIQATARDARGRKQYRYHPRWRETRDATKFERMHAFGNALPVIRHRIEDDLALPGMPREKVVATVVQLLDTTLIRIGNSEYARSNGSYGLCTLREKHVQVRGSTIRFRFRGKSGIEHDIEVHDPRIARIVRQCIDLPGQELFQCVDDDGENRLIGSADINEYLHETAGGEFTAKDFRTWGASVYALECLRQLRWQTAAESKKIVVATVAEVARRLRNTPAICRRCYIHPAIIESYQSGDLFSLPPARPRKGLRPPEAALLRFLQQCNGARIVQRSR
ncbi:MAG TPA: DNA topoisomerase IB [Burkholderiaceae bacterium]|nr:DNA topoisomerase IB [Burkholderiaceae bacterium]